MSKMWNSLLGVILVLSTGSWGFLIKDDPNLLFYFDQVVFSVIPRSTDSSLTAKVVNYNNTNTVIKYNVAVNKTQPETIVMNLAFDRKAEAADDVLKEFNLTLTLLQTPRHYYILSNATANIRSNNYPETLQLLAGIPLESPRDRAFHCSRFGKLYPDFDGNVKLTNYTLTLEFLGLQLQAFNGTPNDRFGEPYDCVGYFTPGILSGVFIAFILIGVITWGLAMIMDVKTMDKFDDPKGKPISFGGPE